jgi:hypothetical protein
MFYKRMLQAVLHVLGDKRDMAFYPLLTCMRGGVHTHAYIHRQATKAYTHIYTYFHNLRRDTKTHRQTTHTHTHTHTQRETERVAGKG